MYCANCGSQVAEGDRFCSKCGTRIGRAQRSPLNSVNKTRGFVASRGHAGVTMPRRDVRSEVDADWRKSDAEQRKQRRELAFELLIRARARILVPQRYTSRNVAERVDGTDVAWYDEQAARWSGAGALMYELELMAQMAQEPALISASYDAYRLAMDYLGNAVGGYLDSFCPGSHTMMC